MDSAPRLGAGIATLLRMIPTVSRPIAGALVVLGLSSAVLTPASTVIIGRAVGALPDAVENGFGSDDGRLFVVLLVLMAVALLCTHLAGQAMGVLGGMLARRVDGMLRTRVLRACLGPSGLDHLHDSDVQTSLALARDLSPAGFSPGAAASGLAPVVSGRLASLFQAGVLVALGLWWLAAVLMAARCAVEVGLLRLFFENLRGLTSAGLDFRRIAWFRDLATTGPAAKEVRVFGLTDWIRSRNRSAFADTMQSTWAARKSNAGRIGRLAGTNSVAEFGALSTVAVMAIDGRLDLAAFVVAVGAVHGVLNMGASNNELAIAYGAAAVPAVLKLETIVVDERFASTGSTAATAVPASEICFEDVRFAYPGGEPVLNGLDLTIPAGQRLAIVGLNGAGKTTLTKLLCRLHEPDRGRIVVDGADLAQLDPASWRRQIGVLFQDYLRYHLPARDNVRFGAVDLDVDDDALDELAQRVGAAEVLDRLDERWDTPLSSTLEGGTELSGGQWQRLALARALLAVEGGARVLVLDEPTANLDVRAEAELYDRFIDLTASGPGGTPLTSILISHRFSTVRRADRIVVLEGGRVVEDGDHDSLVAMGGIYARLFELQAARFSDDDRAEPGAGEWEAAGA